MAKAMRDLIIAFFTSFLSNWIEDFFICVGLIVIIGNTYLISVVEMNVLAGNYLLGLILLVAGFILAKR